ncbi:MAG: hypothetical protein K8J08_00085, partial [Thermoanaerobaculia bacterium]|nr:hypothetical protein [Thermoanaerobaculia bacterium]
TKELKATCEELSAKLSSLERERAADQERNVDEIRRLCDLLTATGEQLSNSHARIASIGKEFDRLQGERLDNASTYRERTAGLEAEISAATLELAKTNHRLSEAEQRVADTNLKMAEVERLAADMEKQLQSTRGSLEKALDRLENSRRLVHYYRNLPIVGPFLRWRQRNTSR